MYGEEIEKNRIKIRADTIKKMKSVGTYKKSFDPIINVYVDLMLQYEIAKEEFIESGYKMSEEYTNKAGATNIRKTAVYMSLESLRKDILSYSTQLGLNPKGLDALNVADPESESVLDKLGRQIAEGIL